MPDDAERCEYENPRTEANTSDLTPPATKFLPQTPIGHTATTPRNINMTESAVYHGPFRLRAALRYVARCERKGALVDVFHLGRCRYIDAFDASTDYPRHIGINAFVDALDERLDWLDENPGKKASETHLFVIPDGGSLLAELHSEEQLVDRMKSLTWYDRGVDFVILTDETNEVDPTLDFDLLIDGRWAGAPQL